jgi:hypothetical protein
MIKVDNPKSKPYCTEESYQAAGINAFGSVDAVESDGWMYICSVCLVENRATKMIQDTFKNSNTRKNKTVLRIAKIESL